MKIIAEITKEQKEFLELIIHTDAANSVGGAKGELGNSVQWCIDACMKIEQRYKEHGIDACYIGFHGTPEEERMKEELNLVKGYPVSIVYWNNARNMSQEEFTKWLTSPSLLNSEPTAHECDASKATLIDEPMAHNHLLESLLLKHRDSNGLVYSHAQVENTVNDLIKKLNK